MDTIKHEIAPIMEGGKIVGCRNLDAVIVDGEEVISQELFITKGVGGETPTSSILIEGTPTFKVVVEPYTFAHESTAAILVNQIPNVLNARPGLIFGTELPNTGAVLGDMRLSLNRWP